MTKHDVIYDAEIPRHLLTEVFAEEFEDYMKPRRIFWDSWVHYSELALAQMCAWIRKQPEKLPVFRKAMYR